MQCGGAAAVQQFYSVLCTQLLARTQLPRTARVFCEEGKLPGRVAKASAVRHVVDNNGVGVAHLAAHSGVMPAVTSASGCDSSIAESMPSMVCLARKLCFVISCSVWWLVWSLRVTAVSNAEEVTCCIMKYCRGYALGWLAMRGDCMPRLFEL